MANALIKLLGHPARAFHHRVNVGSDILSGEAVILGMLHIVENLRRAQQRLGRDAAPVEANPAEVFTLDNGDFQAKLRGTDRRDISAGSGAEDDEVIGCSHLSSIA
jgi:hypothetical protein